MRRSATLAILVGLLAACGSDPIPAEDLSIRVSADVAEIDFGVGFPLTVERIWRKDHVPLEWDDAALAPLSLVLLATDRREDDVRVMETRRFRAHAFVPEAAIVGPVTLRARPRAGGGELSASAPGFRLKVRSALDPGAPGPVEWPGELRRGPTYGPIWIGVIAALAGLGLFLLRRSRRRSPPVQAAPPPPPEPTRDLPAERALGRIASLRARTPADPGEIAAFYEETSRLVRDYAAERFDVPSATRTTEELSTCHPWPDAARVHLTEALLASDLVKFARFLPGEAERSRVLDAAEAFVRETSPGGAS